MLLNIIGCYQLQRNFEKAVFYLKELKSQLKSTGKPLKIEYAESIHACLLGMVFSVVIVYLLLVECKMGEIYYYWDKLDKANEFFLRALEYVDELDECEQMDSKQFNFIIILAISLALRSKQWKIRVLLN